jgi:dienelactone hydrolase
MNLTPLSTAELEFPKIGRFCVVSIALVCALTGAGTAKMITSDVIYQDSSTVLQGYLAYDDSFTGHRPGILVIHEWNGLGSYVKMRAEQLAKLGYVAFGADIYGKGIRPATTAESAKQAGIYRADRLLPTSSLLA